MKRNIVIVSALLLAIILYTYWGLWHTFFQQDEWASMGLALADGPFAVIKELSPVELAAGKARVLGTLLNNVFHRYFPFHIGAFVMFGLTVHWINSVLVYIFTFQMTKRRFAALVAAVYFSVAAVSSGAVTWISAYTTALTNAAFVLVSLICYMKYLTTANPRYKTVSYIAAIVAFLFKESSIFLFVLLPLLSVLFAKKHRSLKKIIREGAPLFIYLIFIVLVRTVSLLGPEGRQGVFVTQQSNVFARIWTHALFYPILTFSQMYVPQEIMAKVTGNISVSDIIATVASMIFICYAILFAYRHAALRLAVFFCLLYSLLSFLPFIVLDRPLSSYLESRYYYLGVIGASILLGSLVDYCRRGFRPAAIVFVFLLTGIVIYKNSVYIRREVGRQIITAFERKEFLANAKETYIDLPHKPIMYISGDSPGFYGIGDLSVPFQQGLGYMMMVWYFNTGKVPKEFLADMYLWNINEQGYKETEGKGFGYFWDQNRLIEEFRNDSHLSTGQILAFRYIASDKKLIDITVETRELVSRSKK